VRRTVEWNLKTQKMLFWIPTLQNSEIVHDSTRPHLHSDGLPPNLGDPLSLAYIGLRVRYKYYKNSRLGLSWSLLPYSTPRADCGLSRPTSIFHTIGVCTILSRSVEIWQYEGQKPVFE